MVKYRESGRYTFESTAEHGHLHILKWLRQQTPQCNWSVDAYVEAAGSSHLHIIRWLMSPDQGERLSLGTAK